MQIKQIHCLESKELICLFFKNKCQKQCEKMPVAMADNVSAETHADQFSVRYISVSGCLKQNMFNF